MKNGKEFIKLNSRHAVIDVEKAHTYFHNLFGDNDDLTKRTNKLINDNMSDMMEEIKPIISETVSQVVFGVFDKLYTKYGYNDLFLK